MSKITDKLDDMISYTFEHAPIMRAHSEYGKMYRQIRTIVEQVEADNLQLRNLISDAVDCWFNHDQRGDYAEMKAMYALRYAIEFEDKKDEQEKP